MMGARIGVKLWQSLQAKRGSMEKMGYSATMMGIEWGNGGRHPADCEPNFARQFSSVFYIGKRKVQILNKSTSLLLVSLRCLFHSSPSACNLGTEQC